MTERNAKGATELSLKRLLYLVLAVAALGGVFLVVNNQGPEAASTAVSGTASAERAYLGTDLAEPVKAGEGPRVWIAGSSEDGRYGKIFDNVRMFCDDIHFTVAGEGALDAKAMRGLQEQDLVILCHPALDRFTDVAELERLIARGCRVIVAAGLEEGSADAPLRAALGIQSKAGQQECREVTFEKPLLPVQPQRAVYGGESQCAAIEVADDAAVYLRCEEGGVPLLYTHAWREGAVCVINGTFLEDASYLGFLSGAIGALLPDFVYPVFGVKTLFLDNFPPASDAGEQAQQVYGYSSEGFAQEVVWPAFQGVSLRTDTPCTTSVLAIASSPDDFGTQNETLLKTAGEAVLQVGGELAFGARCPKGGEVVCNQGLLDDMSAAFPQYTVQGLVLESGDFSREMLDVPNTDIQVVRSALKNRGTLESDEARRSGKGAPVVLPAVTKGNALEDGNLLAICSAVGSYGLVSHVFDMEDLAASAGDAGAWDSAKEQIGLFESEVLAAVPWLEGRTLSDTFDDVKSYREMDFGWAAEGNRVELDCRGAVQGQAFYYHTDRRIADAEGLAYEDVGGGYYLLRMEEAHAEIVLEEGR